MTRLHTHIRRALGVAAALGAAALGMCASAQTGTSAYNFLEIPTSTHVYGLGGTNVAIIDDDIMLVDQNPALLGAEIEKSVGFSYMHYFGQSNFAAARYGMAAGERGAWSIGMRYMDYGKFSQTEADGTESGTFSVQDIVVDGSYSHDFTDRLRGGIDLKMIYSHYEIYSAFALAVDLGINYYDEEHDLSLSAVLKNMGGQVKRFDKAYDRLPFDIQLGYMQGLGHTPFSLSITAFNLTRWSLPYYNHDTNDADNQQTIHNKFLQNLFRHLIFGVQYNPSDKFYIDLAYNYKVNSDMSGYHRNFLSGFSLGLGLKVKSFGIGVAYAMPHKGGSTIMVNLSTNLQELLH